MPEKPTGKSLRRPRFDLPKGTIVTPHHNLVPQRYIDPTSAKDVYAVCGADGAGSVQLTAQLARAEDVSAWNAYAMAYNDVFRSGPVAARTLVTNTIDFRADPHVNPPRERHYTGLRKSADATGSIIAAGETAQLGRMISGEGPNPSNVNCAITATIRKEDIITHRDIAPGQVVIGLRSSGMHSNGWNAAQSVLGAGHPALLRASRTETELYGPAVMAVMRLFRGGVTGTEHVTGNAYGKLYKHIEFVSDKRKIGFRLDNFSPHQIFRFIHSEANAKGHPLKSPPLMFRTFNMGWGFLLFVKPKQADAVIAALRERKVNAERIGEVTDSGKVEIEHEGKRFTVPKSGPAH